MPSKLGIHNMAAHGHDFEFYAAVQPPQMKLFGSEWTDQNLLDRLWRDLPGTTFVMRDQPASEEKDGPDDLFNNPRVCAERHVNNWITYIDRYDWRGRNLTSRMAFLGINEPNTYRPGAAEAINEYEVTRADLLTNERLSAGLCSFSVGHPNNSGTGTPTNWKPYEPIRQAIARARAAGITHRMVLHEYWRTPAAGPFDPEWFPYHFGRFQHLIQAWPEVKIILGEVGFDWKLERYGEDHAGWIKKYPDGQLYWQHCLEVDLFARKFPQVEAAHLFTWDYYNPWGTFDHRPFRTLWIEYAVRERNVPDPVTPPPIVDHPGAIWHPSPNFDTRPGGIDAIVLHATAGALQPSLAWLCNPSARVSAHYVIARDGQVFQLVREGMRAWHAGESLYAGRVDWNDFSIGIELENDNSGREPYPAPQRTSLTALLKDLATRRGIRRENMVTHAQIAQPRGRKTDPAGLDVAAVLDAVYGQAMRWEKVVWALEEATRILEREGMTAEPAYILDHYRADAARRRDA